MFKKDKMKNKRGSKKDSVNPERYSIDEKVLDKMRANVGKYPAETGGMIGSMADMKIVNLYYFDVDSANSPGSFYYNVENTSRENNKWKNSGYVPTGFVHSHPLGMVVPSFHDVATAKLHMDFWKHDFFTMPIVQSKENGLFELYFYVAYKEKHVVIAVLKEGDWMAVLFTSDLHLGHANIILTGGRNLESCGENFAAVEEMNDFLIRKWNEKVKEDDIVYILGDLSYRSSISVKTYLKQLKGRKHLIVGNHDFQWQKNITNINDYFESVSDMKVIRLDEKLITLCHYPLLEWNGSRRAKNQQTSISWLIHGHIHNSRDNVFEYIKDNLPCALNCGVDINGFEPVTFEELLINNNKWYGRSKYDFE